MFMLSSMVGFAGEAVPISANPALEKRVTSLSEELRCLVCQNQTIADSHAELAVDLKNQIREKLGQGMSDKEVIDYMVQRYGDFVLYRPPVKNTTWLLWFGPFLLLFGGIIFLGLKLGGKAKQAEVLPESDMQRASALLNSSGDKK
jgi:cytochrome c-type biogenesis protein CcmH